MGEGSSGTNTNKKKTRRAYLPCILLWPWSLVHSFPDLVQWYRPVCFVCCKSPDNSNLHFSPHNSPCSWRSLCQWVRFRLLYRNARMCCYRVVAVPDYRITLHHTVGHYINIIITAWNDLKNILNFDQPESEWNDLTTGSLFTSHAYTPESLNLTFLIDNTQTSPPVNR